MKFGREDPHGPYPARVPDIIERWSPSVFYIVATALWAATAWLSKLSPWFWLLAVPVTVFSWMGIADRVQGAQSIRRNFPVLGRLRYVLEGLRPEFRQYFVESDQEENPFSREDRTIVYSRSKAQLATLPFGTRTDVYAEGYEWINHSLAAAHSPAEEVRIPIGEASGAAQPYLSSLLNVSAMSYGSLSANAVLALNLGAKQGGFSHNTGEGGVSPYHLEHGGDLVWQIGTGYFGCRADDGGFDPDAFAANAGRPSVKMIEIKLSQGAKPGHGGILPGKKVTAEIAAIRGVPMGQDVISPPTHRAFDTPIGLMEYVVQLRELSGGKPVGFKLCLGSPREFLALIKAMLETDVVPDFITIDGAEGGTGAAPLEFSNHVGTPLEDGLVFIHSAMRGAGLRERTKLIAAGKIATAFHITKLLALGADLTNSARSMMFALGCIQALKCNTNHCPVGVATQDKRLMLGLEVGNKGERVASFHGRTVDGVYELLGAAGLTDPRDLRPFHIVRREGPGEVNTYAEIYPRLPEGSLLSGEAPPWVMRLWHLARPDSFAAVKRS
ncbi:MAG: FMN-binding glutamate synthase family protein [Proteobacteria bacterium]|nr:FMN-binding glutamate synthase family protein [Pseudomonadota bacterium]